LSGFGGWARLVCGTCCALLISACCFPGSVKPTVKVGLSAPFEGRYRDLGYEVLYAVRLAVRQRNEAGGIGGQYLVELVALNDFAEAGPAVVQAQKMGVDDGILGVLGGLAPETAVAAAPEYERIGLAFLHPGADLTQVPSGSRDVPFETEYMALSGGVPPGEAATWAYAAVNRLLDAMDVDSRNDSGPSRRGVGKLLFGD
jgi:ABC-type branched-subunit amino acid transport system substrate-binding protein